MSFHGAPSSGETPGIQSQRNLLAERRLQQHGQLLRERVPFALHLYAEEIGYDKDTQVDPRETDGAQFFVHRQAVTCYPHDRDNFGAQLYQVGRWDDQTLEPAYFPNVAARLAYNSEMHGLRYPEGLTSAVVKLVVRLADAIYDSSRLPNLTGYSPDILTNEDLQYEAASFYPQEDEQSLIPDPAHQLYDAAPIRIAIL